ncbi:hypothetical protein NIES4102_22100 [Chondrocystis sp. NIES-4102]|nr:hypothetical protein NIES4102_22100 [Chondrocystis sp. NIES-4102]
MNKILLLLIAITLLVAGIVILIITAKWSIIPLIFIFLGMIILTINFWSWGKRATIKSETISTIILVILILGIINILASRYNIRWDATENQIFTLSKQSQTIVTQLKQPLKVLIFDSNINPEIEQLLQNYRRYNQQFQFQFINPQQEISLAQQFGVQSLGEIYLQYGEKKEKLLLEQPLSETELTNGIEKIQRDRIINIYFLQGHGEASLELVEGGVAQAITNLENKGNKIQPLNIVTSGTIPSDANLIIIAGATRKLLTAEVTSIQNYLDTGGHLLLLLSPNTDLGIDSLLQTWGIELDDRLIVDGSGAGKIMGFGAGVAIVTNYGKHPITANFANGISLFPESRPIKNKIIQGVQTTPLAITNQQTWAENDLSSEEITFDPNQDLSGPFNIAIALDRTSPSPARLVIFGSSTFITNGWFEQQLNGDIFLNAVSWLVTEDKQTLTIRPKDAANRRLNLSSAQGTMIKLIAVVIMPLLALFTAGVLWWQRR